MLKHTHCAANADAAERWDGDADEGTAAPKDAVVVDAGVSDLDYLKSRMRQSLADEAAASGSDEDAQDAASGEGSGTELEEAEGEDVAGSDEAGETAQMASGPVDLEDGYPGAQAEVASRVLLLSDTAVTLMFGRLLLKLQHSAGSKQALAKCTCNMKASLHVLAGADEATGPAPQVIAASEAAATIIDTGRLFLRNLAYGTTEVNMTAGHPESITLKAASACA
jgi:hypothetical protein